MKNLKKPVLYQSDRSTDRTGDPVPGTKFGNQEIRRNFDRYRRNNSADGKVTVGMKEWRTLGTLIPMFIP